MLSATLFPSSYRLSQKVTWVLMTYVLWYILCLMFVILCLPYCICLCAYVSWCLCTYVSWSHFRIQCVARSCSIINYIVLSFLILVLVLIRIHSYIWETSTPTGGFHLWILSESQHRRKLACWLLCCDSTKVKLACWLSCLTPQMISDCSRLTYPFKICVSFCLRFVVCSFKICSWLV